MNTVTIRTRSLAWFAAGVAVTLAATLIVGAAWSVDAAPGDKDSTYVPITPCRLFDNRQPGDVPFGPDVTRSFPAHGSNGDCMIPTEAVALSLNVTATGASEITYLTIWPDDEPMPLASSLNPAPGQPPTPNAVTTELSPGGRFKIYNSAGVVDVIVDVYGYYTKSSLRTLSHGTWFAKVDADSTGATILHSRGVTSVSRIGIAVFQVDFAEPVNECGYFATLTSNEAGVADEGEITVERAGQFDVDSVWVRTHDSAGTPVDPAQDQGFSVHVVC